MLEEMPVTYNGAIKKKTRRRRVVPRAFRKELKLDMSLFEIFSIDHIKKLKNVVVQKDIIQCKKAASQCLEKENRQPQVHCEKELRSYKKSPVFYPCSPNSTFDKILKKTPLQPLQPVNSKLNSCSSTTSSSGSSLQLASAHRYFTRLKAVGNVNSHSGSSNSEWSMLYKSNKAGSPDLIPNTPLTTIQKIKLNPPPILENQFECIEISRKKALRELHNDASKQQVPIADIPVENNTPVTAVDKCKRKLPSAFKTVHGSYSVILSRNKALNQLSGVAYVPQAQVTSTPIKSNIVDTDICLFSPLGSEKRSEFLSSKVSEQACESCCKHTSGEEASLAIVKEILASSEALGNVHTPTTENMRQITNDSSLENNCPVEVLRPRNISASNNEVILERTSILDGTLESCILENVCISNKNSHNEDILNDSSFHGFTPEEIHVRVSASCCSDASSCSVPMHSLEGTMPEDCLQLCESSSVHSNEDSGASAQLEKCNVAIVDESGKSNSLFPEQCINLSSPIAAHSDIHQEGGVGYTDAHVSLSDSRMSREDEFETSAANALVLTCSDLSAEISFMLQEHLSLSSREGKNDAENESLENRSRSSRHSHTINVVDETSVCTGVRRRRALACFTSPGNSVTRARSIVSTGTHITSAPATSMDSSGTTTTVPDEVPALSALRVGSSSLLPHIELSRESCRILPGFGEIDGRSSGVLTPRKRRNRQSHYVVVGDLRPGLAARHSSGFRSVYDSCPRVCAESLQNLPPSELQVSHVSSVISECEHEESSDQLTARELVLLKCGQVAPIAFSKAFTKTCLNKCKKIGEGVYGEVFLCENGYRSSKSVLKIIPIEGEQQVNCAVQKKYEEILSEMVIAMELSSLRDGTKNVTSAFSEVLRCMCVQGQYPKRLIELWNKFADEKSTENDNPSMFDKDQLFIILELGHAGTDLEAYVFSSAHQTLSVFQQVTCGLAVAELQLEFEHRDLHWGNVLVSSTHEKSVSFTINGTDIQIETKGVKATIIDFTLSRMTFEGCQIFNDLSLDPELFVPLDECTDYQFQIYTLMRIAVGDDWRRFEPKTNVHWLHYLADKMIKMARYLRTRTKVHTAAKSQLQCLYDTCLVFGSAAEFLDTCLDL